MVIIAMITVIFTPFFQFTASIVQADSTEFADSSITKEDIIPGQVLVKYKNPPRNHSIFGVQSTAAQIQTLHFSENVAVEDKIAQLEKDPNVEYAEPVYEVHSTAVSQPDGSIVSNVYFSDSQTYMHNWGKTVTALTYASDLSTPTLNSQVIVAVVDTGVDMFHPDLISSSIAGRPGYDFISNDSVPQDDNGHGTNVAGIIAANANNGSSGYSGVAPGTKILPVKVLDSNGAGSTASVVAGINYAVSQQVNLINLSLGTSGDSQALHDAIKNAVNAGILVVAAAGNEGNNLIETDSGNIVDYKSNGTRFKGRTASLTIYPALYDEVISVGAMEQLSDKSLTLADFSNVGKVDVVAPGVNIYSTYPGAQYRYMSGTSQATPLVTGFAVLLKANNRNLDLDGLMTIIKNSATSLSNPNLPYINVTGSLLEIKDIYGYGLIDGQKSFQLPRLDLKFNPITASLGSNNTVSVDVKSKDYRGMDESVSSSVYAQLFQVSEDENLLKFNTNYVVNLNNGAATASLPLPNADFYHFLIYVDDNAKEQKHITSNAIEFAKRPLTPTPNLSGGTYSGAQQITLTGSAKAAIYYSLNEGTPSRYLGPITISQSSTLRTFSLANHVFSQVDGLYSYVINPIQAVAPAAPTLTGGGGGAAPIGGGGGGGFVPPLLPLLPSVSVPPSPTATPSPTPIPTPVPTMKPSDNQITKSEDGRSSLDVKTNKDYLIDLLNKSKDDIVIDAKSNQAVDAVSIDLDGNVMLKAKEKGTPIVIQSNDLQIRLAPDTIDYKDSKANVKFSAAVAVDQALPTNVQLVSTIYDFNLAVDQVNMHTFNKPIEVQFTIDSTKVRNLNHLGVFYYNDATERWEYVGGTVNKDYTVTAFLPHFSKYAVLENSKSFTDIQSHWAKAEIEEMAAKQIINGMTKETFQPQQSITRAQFVSLLARSLKLENTAVNKTFNDVPANSWYAKDVYSAYNAKIVSGISDHSFAPDLKISREQLAALLVNAYLTATGKSITDIAASHEVRYTDEAGIGSWARANVRIATSLGLMSGVGNGAFNPSGNATRAEAAVVLKRFLDLVK
jgi:subtilisin family serine protease